MIEKIWRILRHSESIHNDEIHIIKINVVYESSLIVIMMLDS